LPYRIKPFLRFATLALLLVSFAANRAGAQATTGQIAGQVTDATGAIIRGADITLVDLEKGVTFTGVSDGAGTFTVVSVPPWDLLGHCFSTGFCIVQIQECGPDDRSAHDAELQTGRRHCFHVGGSE
jgi:Carboxypeptidase regulatory-like domain